MQDITPEDSIVPIFLSPPTKEEQLELEKIEKEENIKKALLEEKQLVRISAINKLSKLGLTEEEAKAIIGL